MREADVQIYAMGVFEPSLSLGLSTEEVSGPRFLAEIAEQTGGRAFSATAGSDLPSVATRIGIELRNQYVLAYQPSNQEKDGKYRRVEVRVNPQPGLPDAQSPLEAGLLRTGTLSRSGQAGASQRWPAWTAGCAAGTGTEGVRMPGRTGP